MSRTYNVQTVDYEKAYGILCSAVGPKSGRTGLHPTFCRVEAGGQTTRHQHFETECYYVIKGQGQMSVNGECFLVAAGDLIRISPFCDHQLRNLGDDELSFLSVYSEDFEVDAIPQNAVITAAPPTPNGPVHLGHISGPYLGSDVVSRYLKLRGSDEHFESGTDDHQNYVAIAANKNGISTSSFRIKIQDRISKGFQNTSIAFDRFWQPSTDSSYKDQVKQYFYRAIDARSIQLEEVNLPYCSHCDHILRDATIQGACPSCQTQGSGTCETCGLVSMPQELHKPRCTACQQDACHKELKVYTFELSKYLPLIKQDIDALKKSPKILALINQLENKISHKVIVAYPLTESSTSEEIIVGHHAIHVWFEMAAHYERYATASTQWFHFCGFDNSFYYLLFIPALHKALNSTAKFMDSVIVNEFLLLDGSKFSTSRAHAIWADEFRGNSDYLRLYLCQNRPQSQEENFSLVEFETYAGILDKKLESLTRNLDSAKISQSDTNSHNDAIIIANRYTRDIESFLSPNKLDLRRAAARIHEFLDYLAHDHLEVDQTKALLIRSFATLAQPFMPETSSLILNRLNIMSLEWINDWGHVQ